MLYVSMCTTEAYRLFLVLDWAELNFGLEVVFKELDFFCLFCWRLEGRVDKRSGYKGVPSAHYLIWDFYAFPAKTKLKYEVIVGLIVMVKCFKHELYVTHTSFLVAMPFQFLEHSFVTSRNLIGQSEDTINHLVPACLCRALS